MKLTYIIFIIISISSITFAGDPKLSKIVDRLASFPTELHEGHFKCKYFVGFVGKEKGLEIYEIVKSSSIFMETNTMQIKVDGWLSDNRNLFHKRIIDQIFSYNSFIAKVDHFFQNNMNENSDVKNDFRIGSSNGVSTVITAFDDGLYSKYDALSDTILFENRSSMNFPVLLPLREISPIFHNFSSLLLSIPERSVEISKINDSQIEIQTSFKINSGSYYFNNTRQIPVLTEYYSRCGSTNFTSCNFYRGYFTPEGLNENTKVIPNLILKIDRLGSDNCKVEIILVDAWEVRDVNSDEFLIPIQSSTRIKTSP